VHINYKIVNLPFRYPFTIARGTKTHQPIFVVELEFNGFKGYGEAPAIAYYNIPAEKMAEDLEKKKLMAEKFALTDPERYGHFLHHLFPHNSFLVCALDMAGWDLYGKLRKKPIYELLNLDPLKTPLTDYTIGIDTTEKMIAKMLDKPWPIYKIKVGTEGDLERLQTLRQHTDAMIRVDANSGWTLEEAMTKIPLFKEAGVELIEQPLHKDDWENMKKLYASSPLPLIADESCVSEYDVEKCAGHFHGINIKLTKCGGITSALKMIRKARQLGLKVMIGCMNETTIGSAAIAHLSPLIDYMDADGPLLLAEDLATGLPYDYGKITLPSKPGLGIDLINPF
jgi:L-alanine-DL-glutamate epimerase-like enolase superfamily enzyme